MLAVALLIGERERGIGGWFVSFLDWFFVFSRLLTIFRFHVRFLNFGNRFLRHFISIRLFDWLLRHFISIRLFDWLLRNVILRSLGNSLFRLLTRNRRNLFVFSVSFASKDCRLSSTLLGHLLQLRHRHCLDLGQLHCRLTRARRCRLNPRH